MSISEKRLLILIPSFNEEQNLPEVLEKLHAEKSGLEKNGWHIDILIINDGSGDNTEKVAKEKGAHVVTLPINLGYGAALQTGFKVARDLNYDAVICMDADGALEPCRDRSGTLILDELGQPTNQERLVPVGTTRDRSVEILNTEEQGFYPEHPIDVTVAPDGNIVLSVMEGRIIRLIPTP